MLILAGALGSLSRYVGAAQGNSSDTAPTEHPWGLKAFRSSLNAESEHVYLEIVDNRTLRVSGRSALGKIGFDLQVVGREWRNKLIVGSSERAFDRSDRSYSGVFNLADNPIDDLYEVQLSFRNERGSTSSALVPRNLLLKYRAGNVFFLPSPAYEDNCVAYAESSQVDPGGCLAVGISDPGQRAEVKSLANTIVAGVSSDYERLLCIHDWVAENIFYNWDGYRSGDYGDTSIPGILSTKIAVCSGYARLTEALLRSVGIPSRVINGHALGARTDGGAYWDSIEHADCVDMTNHAWNEAYVDGRWVIMDVTWDSLNKFVNGKFIKGGVHHSFFDMTLESLSLTHRIRFSS